MAEGFEVIIKYRGKKYHQVASPATSSSEFAILKKDLAHLRVHSPSQKNVRRVNGSFILHWPAAGTSQKVVGSDSLHTRWFKLCSDDPEARKLRKFLSIESITVTQDGVLICSTANAGQASQDAPPGTLVKRLAEIAQKYVSVSVPTHPLPLKPPGVPPPPRVLPTAPRSDKQQKRKRRMSGAEGSPSLTRQKLDVPEVPTTTPINIQLQLTNPPTSPADQQHGSSTPGNTSQPTQEQATPLTHAHTPTVPRQPEPQTIPPSPAREPGEMTDQANLTPLSGPPSTSVGAGSGPTTRPPPQNHSTPPIPASPRPSSSSSGNSDSHAPHRRDRDTNRLTRELWDTRRQLTAMRAREQVILDDLERLGVRPENTAGADRNGALREELAQLEVELKAERARRVRAERGLSEVERECKAPFVVPALFQAFMHISELSN